MTKKNSPEIGFVGKDKKPRIVPSREWRRWLKDVELEVLDWDGLVIRDYVNVRAHVYRKKKLGDACGFYQAIGDYLQMCSTCNKKKCSCGLETYILADDRQISSWDGSRRMKDADNPRIELWITGVEYE